MSERKAINKYYPPDWDPALVPKKKAKTGAQKVRLMLPYSMKCLSCNEYMAARRKFNARKETTADTYMGVKIIRFHIKCPRCNTTLSFQTDPKSASFVPVSGVARNYESLAPEKSKPVETEEEIFERLEREEQENARFTEQQRHRKKNPFWQAREQDPTKDAMANLEEKLLASQREQQLHDQLTALASKSEKIAASGGLDKALEQLQKRTREDVVEKSEPVAVMTVPKVISVKRRKPDREGRAETEKKPQTEAQTKGSGSAVSEAVPTLKQREPEPEKPSDTAVSSAFSGYNSDSD